MCSGLESDPLSDVLHCPEDQMLKVISMTAALALAGLSAEAATMKAVYTGFVTSSNNQTGEFGTDEVFGLNGLEFLMTFIYDPSVGVQSSTSAVVSVAGGEANSGAPTPIISSFITINGVTKSVDGSYVGGINLQSTEPCQNCLDGVDHVAQTFVDGSGLTISQALFAQISDFDLPIPLSLTTPFSFKVPDNVLSAFGSFSFTAFAVSVEGAATTLESVSGSLNLRTVSVSEVTDVAPIPLPAGLPLMAVALGALVILRRRTA
jgi:hypothetical protein